MFLNKRIKKLEVLQKRILNQLEKVRGFRLILGLTFFFLLVFSQIIRGFYLELLAFFPILPLFVFYFRKSLALKNFTDNIDELIQFYKSQQAFTQGRSTRFSHPEEMFNVNLARDLDLGVLYANMDYCSSVESKTQLNEWLCQEFKNSDRSIRESRLLEILKYPGLLRKIQRKSGNHLIEFMRIRKEVERPFLPNAPWKWIIPGSWLMLVIFLSAGMTDFFWKTALFIYVASLLIYTKKTQFLFSRLQDIHKDFMEMKFQINLFEKLGKQLSFAKSFSGKEASGDTRSLEKLISLISLRTNPVIFYILNLLAPLDFLFTELSEKSRQRFFKHFKHWSEEWSLMECLGCFANLKIYHKTSWAEVNGKDDPFVNVEDIRHPLISQDFVTGNSFNPKNKNVIMITGSNMSGKSTFLRAMGINYCLANIGAPVFAEKFYFKSMKVMSCIRVSDSLRDGQSYFFAEVQRMKKIITQANKEPLFFLIDEPLKGTNNRERLMGNQSYINQIVKSGACGFISTHDLELTRLSEHSETIDNYHFSEQWKNNTLYFDYKIKSGASKTTNALKILEKEGLYREKPSDNKHTV